MLSVKDRFWWKVTKIEDGCWVWNEAKTPFGHGQFWMNGKLYVAHRVSYLWAIGDVEKGKELDHICHNPSCVNPEHLRACTHAENISNQNRKKLPPSGYKGVTWSKEKQKWCAQIKKQYKHIFIGYYKNPIDAYKAYCEAAHMLHGEFANTGEQQIQGVA